MRIHKPVVAALVVLGVGAPGAHAHDAEIFATNNTAVITDPADPRLDDPLIAFEREAGRLIEQGGGRVRGSDLLDGVFFDASASTTTFERSRVFAVDGVEPDELHTIADRIRARFDQQSVLTFDRLPASDPRVDAVELDVPSVTADELRTGLLDDREAAERLFGGSVTQAEHLRLVAALEDRDLALAFAQEIGGDTTRARTTFGDREFVEGPLPVRVEQRTLVVDGTAEPEEITLAFEGGRVRVGDAAFARHRFDRIRVDLQDGLDTLVLRGRRQVEVRAQGDRVRIDEIEIDGADVLRVETGDGADQLSVDDLSATDTFQVTADLGAGLDKATVHGSEDDDQISFGAFGVLGPTFVLFAQPEPSDRLTIDGRGGDDLLSASVASMAVTLAGGPGDNVLRGGPGDDTLIGGPGFDDAFGGPGRDTITLGGDFDRASWRAGDGDDTIDGGASRDSLFLEGANAAEAYAVKRGRITHDADVLTVDDLEEVDLVAGGGADTVAIGDRPGFELVDVSLAGLPITPKGDGAADRVIVDGTPGRDRLTLAGKATTATLTGLQATVNISHAEPTDTLTIDTGRGRDAVDTSAFTPGVIGLQILD
ncbi:hypothetical protein C8N24_6560 [Solirubrobacter pauli]|uniref:Hemolysin type calcium-binding protein n=1 Tax=Solirubrobacter pauli TaxID=166793 RepID=A0A660KY45_9ACTN|nr:calcium-binding protein [Solirubrobacter pauli]RKQ84929.1 hypothetical protein C8N24_6560 [Solirubrobacter pauli]